jgi:hypothetical protein
MLHFADGALLFIRQGIQMSEMHYQHAVLAASRCNFEMLAAKRELEELKVEAECGEEAAKEIRRVVAASGLLEGYKPEDKEANSS